MSVVKATEKALKAVALPESDGGTAAVLLKLASAIDDIDDAGLNPAGKLDNVSIPTYLKYAEALGMTPAARGRAKKLPPDLAVSERHTDAVGAMRARRVNRPA